MSIHDDLAAEFGRFLREQRERVSLSLEQVDVRSDEYGQRVTKSYLSRCELGEQLPDLTRLHTLASLYGLSIEEFASRFETCLLLAAGSTRRKREPPHQFSDLIEQGKKASQAGEHAESLAYFQRARPLVEKQDDPVLSSRSVRIGIAFALAALGKAEQAGRVAMKLITESDDDLEVKGNSIILLANSLNMRSFPGLVVAVIRGFEDTLKQCAPRIRGRAKLALSNAHRTMGCAADAEKAARRALVEFKYCGASLANSERAIAHYILAQSLEVSGKRDSALQELKQARALWAKDGAHIKIAQAFIESGEIYLRACNYPAARRHLSRAARLARDGGSREVLLASYIHLWQVESSLGNASRAGSYRRLAKRLHRSLPKETPSLRNYTEILSELDSHD